MDGVEDNLVDVGKNNNGGVGGLLDGAEDKSQVLNEVDGGIHKIQSQATSMMVSAGISMSWQNPDTVTAATHLRLLDRGMPMVENPPVDLLTENNSPSDMHHRVAMEDMELCVSLWYSVLDVTWDQPYYGQN